MGRGGIRKIEIGTQIDSFSQVRQADSRVAGVGSYEISGGKGFLRPKNYTQEDGRFKKGVMPCFAEIYLDKKSTMQGD